MSKLTVNKMSGERAGEVTLADVVAGRSAQVLQDAVIAQRSNRRQGTACTKTKGEVNGSGKKPWRQKGTGRARAGYKQSPVWRGGGVVFGPKPRDYSIQINRKSLKAALGVALGGKVADGAVTVVDKFEVAGPKTRSFMAVLKALKVSAPALVVVESVGRELALAARNVEGVELAEARSVSAHQMVRYPRVVVSQAALAALQQRIGATAEAAS